MSKLFARWIAIIMAVQAKPGIRAVELAEKFEVSKRTIYRDIDGLSAVTPITSEGHGKGFRFIGKFMMYPPDLNDEESVALSMIPFVVDTDKLPRAFHSAFDKIMAAHKGEKNKSINLIDRITERIQMGKPAYRPQSPNFLPVIIQAMLECRTLHTTYHTQYRNSTTVRQIDPYFLVPREQRFYLIGYCRKEERVRIFRVSRFLDAKMTEQTFDKGDFDIHRFLKDTWSIHRGDRKTTFKVKFSAAVARYVKEEELFVQPAMTDTADGGLMFRVTVNNEDEFIRWLLQYGPDAEVLSPRSAREAMKEKLKRWTELYAK